MITRDGETIAYQIDSFDYSKLKLFLLSMLWRAAASTRPEFSRVQLGPYMAELTKMVKSQDPGPSDSFSGMISRFSDIATWGSGFVSPFRERYDGINYYRFITGMYVFFIKVDRQRVREPLNALILCPGRPLIILAREFDGSSEQRAILRLVKMNAAKRRR